MRNTGETSSIHFYYADIGDANRMYMVGYCYKYGIGVE